MTKTRVLAFLCTGLLCLPPPGFAWAWQSPQTANPQGQSQPLSAGQLDSLVAPLALYPDPILSQVLVASTYPLEIVQAAQWLKQNSSLTGKARADAAAKQPWDASVQALVMLPDLLNQLNQDISWTADLGDVFLAQQADVMSAIQRMRQKAQEKGALQSNAQQTVTTTSTNGQNYIVIEPAQPEVVYVPQYNPVAIWGPPAYYPYPPIVYPPASAFISFGAGFALGAIWGGGGWGGWGWGPGWGRNNIYINNNFINRNHFNRVNVGNGNNWVHNPIHRGGAGYRNPDVAKRYQGRGPNNPRPTPAQTEKRLGQGSANRERPGNPSQGGRFGQGTGGANRERPGNPSQGGRGQGTGGANRERPGNASPGGRSGQGIGGGNRERPGTPSTGGRFGQGSGAPAPGGGRAGQSKPSFGGGRPTQGMPSRGGANRMAPGFGGGHYGGGGSRPGGGHMNGNRGFSGGGGGHGGGARGGGHRGGGGGGGRRR